MLNSTVPKTHRGLVSEELLNDFNKLVFLFWIQTVIKKKRGNMRSSSQQKSKRYFLEVKTKYNFSSVSGFLSHFTGKTCVLSYRFLPNAADQGSRVTCRV